MPRHRRSDASEDHETRQGATLSQKKRAQSDYADWQGLDDHVLINAYLKGDQRAFEVLFKKYREHVARLVYSVVKNDSMVEDIVQEVFLLVYRHLHKFKQQAAFKTWIYRITVNEAMRHLGRSKRWQQLPEGEPENGNLPSSLVTYKTSSSPERVLMTGEQKARVHRALDALKPHHKLILTLYYLEDLAVQEIAQVLEIPEGSVKSRLFYARESLRKQLDPVLDRAEPEEGNKASHAL